MERPTMRISGPTFDSPDPIALAEFYERMLGWAIVRREGPRPGNPPTDGWAMHVDGVLDLVDWQEVVGRIGTTTVRIPVQRGTQIPNRGERVHVRADSLYELE